MTVEQQLVDAVGAEHVLSTPDLTSSYGTDWTGRWSSRPRLVVRPASTAEISAVMQICQEHRVPVTTQGGNTGLVGGSVPTEEGAIVLSTRRLQRLDPVERSAQQVTVGAGVSIAELHAHAARAGLGYGVDLAARDTATVGGTIATNAGGIRVVAFGDTRAQVVGVEAVTAEGSVMSHLTGLRKDSAGYDVSGLLVGSEGTLAVITAARLRLTPQLPSERVTSLVGVPSVADALSLTNQQGLLAAELIVGDAMDLVCDVADLPHPLARKWPAYVLIETATTPELDASADAVVDRRVWAYRERQPEAMSSLGVVHSLDVAVPLSQLARAVTEIPGLVAPHHCYIFGHLAEGNLHVQVVGPAAEDDTVDGVVLQYVARLGGSISSEHGVGRAKTRFLSLTRDGAHITAMHAIKRALDPEGLLNPGVLFA